MTTMRYGDYIARLEFDPDIDAFHGEVVNTADVITFQGRSVDELKQEFAKSVDAHIEFCRRKGIEPSRPYSGQFNVRVDPEEHAVISQAALVRGESMNTWIATELARAAFRELGIAPETRAKRPVKSKKTPHSQDTNHTAEKPARTKHVRVDSRSAK